MNIFEAIMNVVWGIVLGGNLILAITGQAAIIQIITTLMAIYFIVRNTITIYENSRKKAHE
jgi:uncharacterized membrane protein YfbV (UPF0208 family)